VVFETTKNQEKLVTPTKIETNNPITSYAVETPLPTLKPEIVATSKPISTSELPKQSLTEIIEDKVPEIEIDGIGQFKINSTLSEFLIKYTNISKFGILSPEYNDSSYGVIEVLPMQTKLLSSLYISGTVCNNARHFRVNNYSISDLILNIDLIFYKDRLIKISTEKIGLSEAIEIKYGKGKTEQRSKDISCSNKITGLTFKESEDIFETNWKNTKKKIRAKSVLLDYVDGKCKKTTNFIFSLYQENLEDEYLKCNEEAKNEIKKLENQIQKNNLSDL
jgi:hypothetical protein